MNADFLSEGVLDGLSKSERDPLLTITSMNMGPGTFFRRIFLSFFF